MSGIFGCHPFDKAVEMELDEYLDDDDYEQDEFNDDKYHEEKEEGLR